MSQNSGAQSPNEAGWYLLIENQPQGPFAEAAVAEALQSKRIAPEVLSAKIGADRWLPLRAQPAFTHLFRPTLPPPAWTIGGDRTSLQDIMRRHNNALPAPMPTPAKPVRDIPAENTQYVPRAKPKLAPWKVALACVALTIIMLILATRDDSSPHNAGPSGATYTGESGLAQAVPSSLSPDGELAAIFNLGSRYTDVQRENTAQQIVGKIVRWRLPVYEIERDGSDYSVITSDTYTTVGTVLTLSPQNDAERAFIESLTEDQIIVIRGKIQGVNFLRQIEIDPAILDMGIR